MKQYSLRSKNNDIVMHVLWIVSVLIIIIGSVLNKGV